MRSSWGNPQPLARLQLPRQGCRRPRQAAVLQRQLRAGGAAVDLAAAHHGALQHRLPEPRCAGRLAGAERVRGGGGLHRSCLHIAHRLAAALPHQRRQPGLQRRRRRRRQLRAGLVAGRHGGRGHDLPRWVRKPGLLPVGEFTASLLQWRGRAAGQRRASAQGQEPGGARADARAAVHHRPQRGLRRIRVDRRSHGAMGHRPCRPRLRPGGRL